MTQEVTEGVAIGIGIGALGMWLAAMFVDRLFRHEDNKVTVDEKFSFDRVCADIAAKRTNIREKFMFVYINSLTDREIVRLQAALIEETELRRTEKSLKRPRHADKID